MKKDKRVQQIESDAKFRDLAEKSPNMIFINCRGKVIYVNKLCEEMMGYTREEFYSPDFDYLSLVAPESVETVRQNFAMHIAGQEVLPYEYTLITKGGTRIEAIHTTKLIDFEGDKAILGIVTDITERMKAERALRSSEEKYRTFFQEDLTGDYICSPEGKILFCNPAFCRIFGFEAVKEAMDHNIASLYRKSEAWERLLERLQNEKRLEKHNLELRRIDGTPVYVVQNVIGVFDGSKLKEIRGYLFDITELKRLEEQLLQAQKMEAIGRLAGGVAHDFNNLLTIIGGNSELLLGDVGQDERKRRNLEQINKAVQQAASLTSQLLAFSRKQMLQPQLLDPNELLSSLDDFLRRVIGEDIELVTVHGESLGLVEVDPSQFEQVIMNLVVNARDAMPRGGKLTIETAKVDFDEAFASKHGPLRPGPYVMLVVSDTGMGMGRSMLSQIFEPFFTTKQKDRGTGLGLSTVYGIVKQSGGMIDVDSEPGRGTTFNIYLPRRGRLVPSPEQVNEELTLPPAGAETILLVEDNQAVRDLARSMLEGNGYKVLTAGNGIEALRLCEGDLEVIDLLVTDVVMPDLSGPDLAKRLVSAHPEARVLYISGHAGDSIIGHGVLEAGSAFLQKPFTIERLTRKVRDVLDRLDPSDRSLVNQHSINEHH